MVDPWDGTCKIHPDIHLMYWVSIGYIGISPFGIQPRGLNSLGALHPKGTRIFPRRGRAWSSFMCFSTCSSSSLAWDCVFATDLAVCKADFCCPVNDSDVILLTRSKDHKNRSSNFISPAKYVYEESPQKFKDSPLAESVFHFLFGLVKS